MSQALMKKISGEISVQNLDPSLIRFPFGLKVELVTLGSGSPSSGAGGWIGSSPINPNDRNYEILTTYAVAQGEQVAYTIYKDAQVVQQGQVAVTANIANIVLTKAVYDDLNVIDQQGSISIRGKVTLGAESITAVPLPGSDVVMSVHKVGFRNNPVLVTGPIDGQGNYILKVPLDTIATAISDCCVPDKLDQIFVSLKVAGVLAEQTDFIQIDKECTVIDIHTDKSGFFPAFMTELDYIIKLVSGLTDLGVADFHTITTEGSGSELQQIMANAGNDAWKVFIIVQAAIISNDSGIILAHTYALAKALGIDPGKWADLDYDTIASIIENARLYHIISDTGVIQTTYDLIIGNKVTLSSGNLTDNGEKISDVLGFLGFSSTVIRDFLKLDLENGELSPDAFWDKVAITLPSQKVALQRAVQILGFTGMQKEVSKEVTARLTPSGNLQPVSNTSSWDYGYWFTMIQNLSETYHKTCVPNVIIDRATAAGRDPIEDYAHTLVEVTTNVFATRVIQDQLGADPAFAQLFGTNATAVRTFLSQNQAFDFRHDNAWDINTTDDPAKVPLRNAMLPVQNVMRLTGGKPAAVIALMKGGIKSSADIAAMSADNFVNSFSTVLGGIPAANLMYVKGQQVASLGSQLQVQYNSNSMKTPIEALQVVDAKVWESFVNNPPANSQSPDLKTLFGSMDMCSCSECMSLYSPAAYYTDILNFMKTKLTIGSSTVSLPYNEILRRRPDLEHIDLSCKNANTAIPYIDLINEQLELLILKKVLSNPNTPLSYQTYGPAKELEAYPEHMVKLADGSYVTDANYKDVYDITLKNAVYPNILPLNLALEESRVYFNHLGYSRHELMQLFRPSGYLSGISASDAITEYNDLSEQLGLSRKDREIIITTGGLTREFYGFNSDTNPAGVVWYEELCNELSTYPVNNNGLRTLLERANISYRELLEILDTDFLNPRLSPTQRTFEITSVTAPLNQDTCDLGQLKIISNAVDVTGSKTKLFGRLHRFIRLQRACTWSIYQMDLILTSLNATDINEVGSVSIFKLTARIKLMADRLGMAPEKLAAFWSSLSNVKYTNYNSDNQQVLPSVYDSLFNNKAVLNPPDSSFSDPLSLPATYPAHKGTILAASNLQETELIDLFTYVNNIATPYVLNLANLSRVYALSNIAHGLNLPVDDLLRLCALFQVNGAITGTPSDKINALTNLITVVDRFRSQAFSLDELEYLIAHKDTQGVFVPPVTTIELFYEGLRAELKKQISENQVQVVNQDALINIVLRQFSVTFGMDAVISRYLLEDVVQLTNLDTDTLRPMMELLTDTRFINATEAILPGSIIGQIVAADELYGQYTRIDKTVRIISRLMLSAEEFNAIQEPTNPLTPPSIPGIAVFGFIDCNNLPVTGVQTVTLPNLEALLKLSDWIKVRDQLNLDKTGLLALFRAVLLSGSGTAPWVSEMAALTSWTEVDLNLLVSAPNILGISASPVNDFKEASLQLQVIALFNACNRIGLSVDLTYSSLLANLVMDNSRNIRQAAKAKHKDEEWLKVAKPLQDVLREQQRQALVAFVVARPDLGDDDVNSVLRWKQENDLFAYLLIDVEMKPCMKTSRLKQGISTLQLFMDRVILNLENKDGLLNQHISILPDKVTQWRTWRKWYRVWEANRKIFLYPENWIEPELRDDKTPFFKDLETQLLQDDVTDSKVEDAFREYLDRVDEVAKLEPVTAYHQVENDAYGSPVTDIKHVFSRTVAQPYRYFYRRLQNNEWTPWEKVNVDIKSDHVIPVMWNRKLSLFWMTFTRKSHKGNMPTNNSALWTNTIKAKNDVMTIVSDTNSNDDDLKFSWDLKLNWSHYKDGKWLATEISEDTTALFLNKYELTNTESATYNISQGTLNAIFRQLTDYGDLDLAEFFRNRTQISVSKDNYLVNNGFSVDLIFFGGLDEGGVSILTFIVPEGNGKPYILRGGDTGSQLLAPIGTRASKMKFEKISDNNQSPTQGKLKIEQVTTYKERYFAYMYGWWYTNNGTFLDFYPHLKYDASKQPLPLLDKTGVTFRLTRFGNTPDNTFDQLMGSTTPRPKSLLENYFFFEDRQHTFYVEKVEHRLQSTLSVKAGVSSLSIANKFSSVVYASSPQAVVFPVYNALTFAPAILKEYTYRFHTFYHAQINLFLRALNKDGVPGLLQLGNQKQEDTMAFGGLGAGTYQPTTWVHNDYPRNNVQFGPTDAYSIYNWEIFFHSPMLIAQRLSANQQFEEAQKWYHYIFNPTSSTGINNQPIADKRRYWKFYPFYEQAAGNPQTLPELLQAIADNVATAKAQVTKWEANPFQPHVIARMRVLAYMKNVLMKYLDNLIAWGDQLFRRDTIESINEATQLYILAANILGKRPESIPPRVKKDTYTFQELLAANPGGLDKFSNGQIDIESFFAPNTGIPTGVNADGLPTYGTTSYFCLPQNDKLLAYWDTVADRLFKIRNCMNIEGAVRQLPLYEPPIDPALLVRATALGVDINSILDSFAPGNIPYLRFSYVLQKANEFCGDVRALGGALLSALEKKDAEHLALLRSGQELQLLEQIRYIKEQQVQEAETNLEAAQLAKENTDIRFRYYNSRPFMNEGEQQQMQSVQTGLVLQAVQGALEGTVSTLSMVPTGHLQGLATGTSIGGVNLANAMKGASAAIGIAAIINSAKGTMAGTKGSYERRRDDWSFQTETASKELEQMDQQILAAEIRLDISRRELANHELQIENATDTDSYMRSKFSNEELYTWMSGQIATTYFQSYQMAYDMARKAQECFRKELPATTEPSGGFITFGYWDSLRKGLMSGEKLQFDLRKMEVAYMEGNKREFELTKHFSLALLDPLELIRLRRDGICNFFLSETWYDLDFPGQYMRKVKSVSISIPCITGPYTTISSKLSLDSSSIRTRPTVTDIYPVTDIVANMATSSAQNDAGVFELNFRDERYLPFENAGAAESQWTLSLMEDVSLRQFDYGTISDVIIHVKYTAREEEGGAGWKTTVLKDLQKKLFNTANGSPQTQITLPRYFSLKHEFSNEWYKGFSQTVPVSGVSAGSQMDLLLQRSQFPEYAGAKAISILSIDFILKPNVSGVNYRLAMGTAFVDLNSQNGYKGLLTGFGTALNFSATTESKACSFVLYKWSGTAPQLPAILESDLEDVFFVIHYKLS